MPQPVILVVDDEEPMRELVRLYLERESMIVEEAADGIEALAKLKYSTYDLVVLDLMMPELDGWEVCRRIRASSDLPILMLTARSDTYDRILGLNLGADDYLPKPFDGRELAARVSAVLRRNRPHREAGGELIRWGALSINTKSRQVQVKGSPVLLTPKEYDLLHLLAIHPGQVFTREHLLALVWGQEFEGGARTIDTHIKNLREKIGEAAALIGTVWGVGYRFEATDR